MPTSTTRHTTGERRSPTIPARRARTAPASIAAENAAAREIQRLKEIEDRYTALEAKIAALEEQIPDAFRGEPGILFEAYDQYRGKVMNMMRLTSKSLSRALLADPRAGSQGVRRIQETLRTELAFREEAQKRERAKLGLDPLDAEHDELHDASVRLRQKLRAWSPANAAEATALLAWVVETVEEVRCVQRLHHYEIHAEDYPLMQRCVAELSRQAPAR